MEGGPRFENLRVRIYSRRPLALRAEHCRALCFELQNPYRLMWQWALCTGLRTISLVQMELPAFESLQRYSGTAQTLDIRAKGGKVVTVHVPQELRRATERYIDVDRVMAAALGRPKSPSLSLFLNLHGRPVTGKSYYRALKRAGRRLKITAHPHQARTTFATYIRDKLQRLNCEGREIDAVSGRTPIEGETPGF
jgi:integrase